MGRDIKSHIIKESVKTDHSAVPLDNFIYLKSEYHQKKLKQKLSEILRFVKFDSDTQIYLRVLNEREKQESRVEARIKVNIVQYFNWISSSSLFLTLFSI